MQDLVVGIDASTTAVKAIAFQANGTPLAEARRAYPMATPLPGHVEQDADDWWNAVAQALADLTARIDPSRIAGLAIAHQRETFAFIDAAGRPIRPAILWLDERARREVDELSRVFGRERIRQWTGKPPDPTPALYAIAWLTRHEPASVRGAARLVDVSAFLNLRLTGKAALSIASADPLGLVDLRAENWQPDLVKAAGLIPSQLPDLVRPGALVGTVSAAAAASTGLRIGTPVFAGAGDGQSAGLGLGAHREGTTYLSLGSGIVSGIHSRTLKTSEAYRTLIAPTGHGYMMETVLRTGMQLLEWVVRTTGATSAQVLEKEAMAIAPGSDGLMLLPYFSGVMNPYWDEAARGAMIGLSLGHTRAHIFRAALESIAFEQSIATSALEGSIDFASRTMVASGGGTNSQLLMSILAAVLGRSIGVSTVQEAAALGAGILAAAGAGWFDGPEAAADAMSGALSGEVDPDPTLAGRYEPLRQIYAGFYKAVAPLNTALFSIRN